MFTLRKHSPEGGNCHWAYGVAWRATYPVNHVVWYPMPLNWIIMFFRYWYFATRSGWKTHPVEAKMMWLGVELQSLRYERDLYKIYYEERTRDASH